MTPPTRANAAFPPFGWSRGLMRASSGSESTALEATASLVNDRNATACWADDKSVTKSVEVRDPATGKLAWQSVTVFVECGVFTLSATGLCEHHQEEVLGRFDGRRDEPTLENLLIKGRRGA